jgi:hypothetical protein
VVSFDRELKNEEMVAGNFGIFTPMSRYSRNNTRVSKQQEKNSLKKSYLDSGARIQKSPATISSFFNCLSNETTPIKIEPEL